MCSNFKMLASPSRLLFTNIGTKRYYLYSNLSCPVWTKALPISSFTNRPIKYDVERLSNFRNQRLTLFHRSDNFKNRKFPTINSTLFQPTSYARQSCRCFSSERKPFRLPPTLMKIPIITVPSIFKTIYYHILISSIKFNYDPDFDIASFASAAKKVVIKLSGILSRGDFEELEKYVDKAVVDEVKENYNLLSPKAKADLAVTEEDLLYSFVGKLRIITKNTDGPIQRAFVEITMCYYIYKGYQQVKHKVTFQDAMNANFLIANYRFIKEVTKGIDDQWNVNALNHVDPSIR